MKHSAMLCVPSCGTGVVHFGQGMPAPQPHAKNDSLSGYHANDGWFSQTWPVSSQVSHLAIGCLSSVDGDTTACDRDQQISKLNRC